MINALSNQSITNSVATQEMKKGDVVELSGSGEPRLRLAIPSDIELRLMR
jgi:hypothetical protein